MQTDNKLLDDLARVATSAMGTLQGVRDEVETRMRKQFERVLANMDMVTREEFDAVAAMAQTARQENEDLKARLDALEKKPARRPRTTRATAKKSAKK